MVATLLKLKLKLVVAELKRSTVRLVLWIIGSLYALLYVGLMAVGLIFTRSLVPSHIELSTALTVIGGSLLVLLWLIVPPLLFGSDQTLDPSRFALFSLTGRQLALPLTLASVLGVPGILTLIVGLSSALAWSAFPLATVFTVVGALLGVTMAMVGCRVVTTFFAATLSSRRGRDFSSLVAVVGMMLMVLVLYIGINVMSRSGFNDSQIIVSLVDLARPVGDVLSWTPLGAPWSIGPDVAAGHWGLLVIHLAITLVFLALGLWAYGLELDRAIVSPLRAEGSSAIVKGDFIASVAGASWVPTKFVPAMAIAARCLRYWRRDPRYLASIPAMLLMPVIMLLGGSAMGGIGDAGLPEGTDAVITMYSAMFGAGMMAILAGFSLSADIAYDSTAWWLHLTTGVKGWMDRLGRVLGEMVWCGPLVIAAGIVMPIVTKRVDKILVSLGVMIMVYLVSLGVSSIASALIIYPVAMPGESALHMKTGMMGSQLLSQMGCLIVATLACLPVTIWAIAAPGYQAWMIFLVGLVFGLLILGLGIVLGGKVIDARGPSILMTLKKNDSRVRA